MQTFVQIRGLSNKRRLPRLGKIRLGVKVRNPTTGNEHPAETSYFVVPPEVAKIYGEQPTALDIMFPVNDPGRVFPQALKWYGSGRGLKCIGNGETAMRMNDETREMEQRECPCEHLHNDCAPRACLQIMLPKINMGGVYQIDSGSSNSMVDLNSYFDYLTALIGRFAMVPLTLRREPKQIQGPTGLKTHYPLKLELTATQEEAEQLLRSSGEILDRIRCWQIPPPEEVNPAKDDSAVVVLEDDWQKTHDDVDPSQSPSTPPSESNGTGSKQQTPPPLPDDSIPDEPTAASANVSPDDSTALARSCSPSAKPKTTRKPSQTQSHKAGITQRQRAWILRLAQSREIPTQEVESQIATMTKSQASAVITQLQNEDFSALQTTTARQTSSSEDEHETEHQTAGTTYKAEF